MAGSIAAEQELWVPFGPRCGSMTPSGMAWLRRSVSSEVGSLRDTLVVVWRRVSRTVADFNSSVLTPAAEHAAAWRLRLYVHDDDALPSVREQVRQFGRAAIILLSHGAASLFLPIATAPACVIEIHPTLPVNMHAAQQAATLGHWYQGLHAPAARPSQQEVRGALERCQQLSKFR